MRQTNRPFVETRFIASLPKDVLQSLIELVLAPKTLNGVGWLEERRPVGVRVSVSEREASRREGASRRVNQHFRGFVRLRFA
ncbi:hypothetical protein [uncultured Nostoc sp.]|uniref:hypothetical protein n=1 Tax=uncultured Nostoc sp. TaxID=340711 RepID=UPI0035C97D87